MTRPSSSTPPTWRGPAPGRLGGLGGAGDGARRPVAELDYAPLIVAPDKIVCCGLNYRTHILEFTRELPSYPTLFAKYRSTLTGANDDIELPTVTEAVDWEVELAVIIGAQGRGIAEADAAAAIAGYAVLNDVSMRDYQNRTLQWLQGKCFEATTPLGPWLVTSDESPGPSREVVCEVDGEVKQKADTSDLLFGPEHLVSYISDIITLEPGDVIATGTPAALASPGTLRRASSTAASWSPGSKVSASAATSSRRPADPIGRSPSRALQTPRGEQPRTGFPVRTRAEASRSPSTISVATATRSSSPTPTGSAAAPTARWPGSWPRTVTCGPSTSGDRASRRRRRTWTSTGQAWPTTYSPWSTRSAAGRST